MSDYHYKNYFRQTVDGETRYTILARANAGLYSGNLRKAIAWCVSNDHSGDIITFDIYDENTNSTVQYINTKYAEYYNECSKSWKDSEYNPPA